MQYADVPLFSGNGLVSWYPARFCVGENGALSCGSEMVQLESNISWQSPDKVIHSSSLQAVFNVNQNPKSSHKRMQKS